jgi:starvation-inducible DNA-binding protein
MHPTRNTLPETSRIQSVEVLNRTLAAAIDLHAQLKHAHWNVRGPGFFAIHTLFDTIAAAAETYSDQIAERTGSLGGEADGRLESVTERSCLTPDVMGIADTREHLFVVAGALATFGEATREAGDAAAEWGDAVTADLFTEITRSVDQHLWFVESHGGPK